MTIFSLKMTFSSGFSHILIFFYLAQHDWIPDRFLPLKYSQSFSLANFSSEHYVVLQVDYNGQNGVCFYSDTAVLPGQKYSSNVPCYLLTVQYTHTACSTCPRSVVSAQMVLERRKMNLDTSGQKKFLTLCQLIDKVHSTGSDFHTKILDLYETLLLECIMYQESNSSVKIKKKTMPPSG